MSMRVEKNGKNLESIIDNPVITCDEIIQMEAKLYDEKRKTVPTNFNEKKIQSVKQKILYFTCLFINYH